MEQYKAFRSLGMCLAALLPLVTVGCSKSSTLAAPYVAPPVTQVTVTASATANGTISPAGATTVAQGTNATYTFTPATGYQVVSVRVDGVDQGAVGTYTFTNLQADHDILAIFSLPNGANLVVNPGAEIQDPAAPAGTPTPLNWNKSSWSDGTTNVVTFTELPTGHSGNHSLKTEIANYSVDGDAKWYPDFVNADPTKVYEFSDWYQSNTESYVVVDFMTWDNVNKVEKDVFATIATLAPSADWQQVKAQFSVPSQQLPAGLQIQMTVFHLVQSTGWVITDDYSLSTYAPVGLTRPLVSVTLDDGIASSYTNGAPVFATNKIPATFFIISGLLGQDGSISGTTYMTPDNVIALSKAGHEIGGHTLNHPDLDSLSATDIDYELSVSQTELQNLIGKPVTNFASPYGDCDQLVTAEVRKFYASHRSVITGFNSLDKFNAYNLVSQDVNANVSPAQVAAWVAQAKATNTWLILVYHAIDPTADPVTNAYATTPADLATEMAALAASGVQVSTVHDALAEVTAQLTK